MDRLVIDDRKATVTQPLVTTKVFRIPSLNRCSRRPHRVPLLSANNWKRRLQFAHAHQNWTIEDWKNVAWSDESRFLLRHSDGRVRIWCKEHESIDPSCLVSTVQGWWWWWCNVWGIFSFTSERCLYSGVCGGHLSKVNSLSCSRNQSEMI